ncbi:UDP-glucuronate 5-epimerase [Tabrizicola sp. TH137]|uniref:NAD-dependent epimerase/dehydratase family protein n=1 Tax=Tabrizicola sp. TH137 TaxID=2067452 RepID=UPI000C7A0066|nr:NAD-dependent epimerase/dehydratase family protein [Tabrizicola sp. TH137]PLL11019.1 UDP-glucuronate 5-epimerase [Tabrizicola sp. TH137]
MANRAARRALVTGSAGFIGYHLCRRLLADGWEVTGLDAMTSYYDVTLKERRRAQLLQSPGYRDVEGAVETPGLVADLAQGAEVIVHLAAQAGVRYSIDHPRSYVEANLIGTYEVLEAARATKPAHLLIASTSSVYGANEVMPYAEVHKADHPMSFYAATKKAGEAMGHSYAHLYAIPTTMFRFFTVYGPWGRPDMALFKFVKAILAGEAIDIYNHGDMRRDFTYVDDLIEGISRLIDCAPAASMGPLDSLSPVAPFRIVNIGNGSPVGLMDFVQAVEEATGRIAEKNLLPMQPGDVPATWADAGLIEALTGPLPRTDIRDGVRRFVDWYRDFYRV